MFRKMIVAAALLLAMPAFSASTTATTPQQCQNPNQPDGLCLFQGMAGTDYQAGINAVTSLVAMAGSVCALPARVMAQFGQQALSGGQASGEQR
ncbi:MAG: hypothetical protein Kow006_01270 [Gammaproteobacteria bacterium]